MTAELSGAVSNLVVGVAVLAALLGLVATRSYDPAVPILLDLLLAAGLLRLTADHSWQAIGTAGAIVAVRRIAVAAIGLARRAPVDPA